MHLLCTIFVNFLLGSFGIDNAWLCTYICFILYVFCIRYENLLLSFRAFLGWKMNICREIVGRGGRVAVRLAGCHGLTYPSVNISNILNTSNIPGMIRIFFATICLTVSNFYKGRVYSLPCRLFQSLVTFFYLSSRIFDQLPDGRRRAWQRVWRLG